MSENKTPIEYKATLSVPNGTELKLKIRTECSTGKELEETLSFIVAAFNRFHLQVENEVSFNEQQAEIKDYFENWSKSSRANFSE